MAAADAPRGSGSIFDYFANMDLAMEAIEAMQKAYADSMVGVMVRIVDDGAPKFIPISADEFYVPSPGANRKGL